MKPGAQPVASSSACASRIHSGTILTWHGSPLSSTAIGDAHCTRFMLMLRARLLTTSVSSQDSRRAARGDRLPSTEGVSERSARIMILKCSSPFGMYISLRGGRRLTRLVCRGRVSPDASRDVFF